MRKLLSIITLSFLLALVGCTNTNNFQVDINQELYFHKDKESSFQIKVTDSDQPVEGLNIQADFSMVDMDHGHYEAQLNEINQGIYQGQVKLPMEGDWEIVITVDHDGEIFEKVIEYEVKKSEGVATINGEWITENDIEFYHFINKLHIGISREKDEQTYKGEALEEALAYWDAQEKLTSDRNQLLTQIIRLRSMALLGAEKGHTASQKEIDEEIKKVKEQYYQFEVAKNMIKEFGEDKFWSKQQSQYELIVLSQKVQNDLVQKVKDEHPDVNQQEIYYLAQKEYEELLVSQVNSLKIEF